MTMSEGEIAKLTIPSHKGYGASGFSSWGYPFNFEKSLLHYVKSNFAFPQLKVKHLY